MRGPMTADQTRFQALARTGSPTDLTNHFNQVSNGGKNLNAMFGAVNAMQGINNPAIAQMRATTMSAARSEIAAGAKTALPWAVVAQMSLQDNNQAEFNTAADRLRAEHPNSEYNHFFGGIRHLQNREYAEAEASLRKARELGMSEESIAELLKTAIDNQKWIWEYATAIGVVVGVWLVGLGLLYLFGHRFSKRTLKNLAVDEQATSAEPSAADRRMRTWYRRLIGIAGIYYYISLPIVVVVSLALPAALGYATLMVPYVNLLLMGAVLLLGIGGIVTAVSGIRTAFLRIPEVEDGRLVAAKELPELWALVRETAEKVGTRAVDEIRLVPGADIAVYEKGSYLEKLRDRGTRVLILGLGALPGLKVESFKAILAHEYGHFQNRDTAGGDIALRVYLAMDGFAGAIVARGQIRKWDVAVHFLIFYHRLFRKLTFGASRLQEIYADRKAVVAYGATAFRDGLTQAIRRSIELDWALGKTLDDLIRTRRALSHFYRSAPLPDLGEREQIETVLAEVIARPTDVDDSHPSPKDRFRLAAALDPRTEPVPEEFVSRLIEADPKMATELGTSLDEKITARAKAVLHELDEGVKTLSQIINRTDHPDARYERARLLMDKGDYAGVVKDLDVLLKLAPDAGPIRFMRARAYEKLGRYVEAIADLELVAKSLDEEKAAPGSPEALETDQVRTQVLLRTAQCLASAERLPEASAMYDRVLAKTPKSLAALIGRGRVAVGMKAAAKALADFTSAVTHWPTSAEPLLERAELYSRCGRAEQAAADHQAAALIDRRVAEERKKQPKPPAATPQPQKPATSAQPPATQKPAAQQPSFQQPVPQQPPRPHLGPPAVSPAGPHAATAPKSHDPNPVVGRRE